MTAEQKDMSPFTVVIESPAFGVLTIHLTAHCSTCAFTAAIKEIHEKVKDQPPMPIMCVGIFKGLHQNYWGEVCEKIKGAMALGALEKPVCETGVN